ncbi:amidohydrolase family protein [Sandarakinorhabdus rubra]|uniref:amidohydrolase family protein n=1 Tax=Sandarakinorhabdus rubra TaxID=2672568 RepID=UPI0013DC07C7|nr:amidohydrolase family protein [Sandarakinorhabdus rubra]
MVSGLEPNRRAVLGGLLAGAAAPALALNADRPLLLAGGGVLVGDRVQEGAALAIVGGRIAAVGAQAEIMPQFPTAEVVDTRGKVVMPGLVNCHSHLAATLERGFNEDFGFPNSARLSVRPASLLGPEEHVLMTVIGALEAIRTGTTTLVENVAGIAPTASALAGSGLRMVLAESVRDSENVPGPMAPEGFRNSVQPVFSAARREEGMQRIADLFSRWHGHDNGRVMVLPAAALAETASPELLRAVRDFADVRGLSYTIHLSQSVAEVEFMKRWHGVSPVRFLERHGFLGPRLFAAHCRYVDAADIAALGAARITVSHQAGMAANRGVIPPIPALRAAGCNIAHGTDNNTTDAFTVLRTALLTERIARNDDFPGVRPQPEDVWEDGTLGGAKALGLEREIGTLAVGKKADLIVVNALKAHLVPAGRFLSALVHNGQPSDVESLMVDGRWVMKDGKVLTLDEAALVAEADKVGRRVWAKVQDAGRVAVPGRPGV